MVWEASARALHPLGLKPAAIPNPPPRQIYSENRPVEEVVDQMCRFKASGSARQAEVFRCMVHNLLDEFRFFPNYPEKVCVSVGGGGVDKTNHGARAWVI